LPILTINAITTFALQFKNVLKSDDKKTVLHGVNLGIAKGESTLIKCLLDFCATDEGTIEISVSAIA
jgi:ABC-type Mn2+/Zn2+ transport system ATPase subunit